MECNYSSRDPISWGSGRLERRGRLLPLLRRRRLAMLPALDELLVQRDALLAEGTGLGGIRREVPADETEDLLAVDLCLFRAAPERTDTDDLAAHVLHELREESHRRARADEVLDDQHLGSLANEPVKFGGQRDASLAAAHSLCPVDQDRARRMCARDTVRQDQGARTGREHHVDGPRGEVF